MKNNLSILLITLLLCSCNDSTTVESTDNNLVSQTIKQQDESQNKEPSKEKDLFDFSYPDLDSNEVKLSDFRGKWVVVNFWATWCPPCRKEIPDFVKFKSLYSDQVEILGIDNEDADIEVIRQFAEDYHVNYPILIADVYNPSDFDRENTMGLPTTVIFNPKGEQVNKRIGPVHFEDLMEFTGFKPKKESSPK